MISDFLRSSIFFVLAASSCAKTKAGSLPEPGADGAARPNGVEVGARVIVENATAAFVEGTVVAVVRDRARVQLASSGEVTDQSLSEVYVPSSEDVVPSAPATAEPVRDDAHPSAARSSLRDGSYAVCHMPDNRWRGCRIETVAARATVVDDEATTAELPWHALLAPTPVTELNVRQRFDRNAKRRAFRDGARSAGRPRVPGNWRPGINERVIAERDGAWVGAQIKGVKRGTARLEWESDRRLSDTNLAEVCPEPPIDFAPTVGTYVLARPARGARTWAVLRVESTGAGALVLSDEVGDQQERSLRDLIPLERGGR